MYDEEKEEIKSKRIKKKKRIWKRFKNSKKTITVIIIIFIIFIISLICSLSYNFIFKTNNIIYGNNTLDIDQIKTEFLEEGRTTFYDNSFKSEEEFFLNYKKEINFKNEEYENNILVTDFIKNKLEEIRIIKENNTIIENNDEINFIESNKVYLEAKNYINKIINTPFSFENLKNFSIKKNPKISIIIPVYNSEEYLKSFLKYIDNQAFEDIEIIYIDDCSTDNSIELIEKFQEKDHRIILLKNKKNRGPFYSRNKGALFSRGDYIQFIDSDDFLVGNILEKAYKTAQNKKVDIVQYSIIRGISHSPTYINERTHKNIIYQPELSDQMYYGKGHLEQANLYMINKLIKKKIFYETLISMGDDILNESLYMQEDAITLFCLLRVANSLIIIDDIGYYYALGLNHKSLVSKIENCSFANQVLHSNFIELKLIFNKTKNNEHDKGACVEYFKMICNLHFKLIPFITKGFELFDEVFDLLLNCPYFNEENKDKFRNFKNRLMKTRNNLNKANITNLL